MPRHDARKRLCLRNLVSILKHARLMVDKAVIRDEFPDWFSVLNGAREVRVSSVK